MIALLGMALIALIVGLAATLPFAYPSQSLNYKFGLAKHLLRGGKILGLTAFIALALQWILACRFRILDQSLGLDRVMALHRRLGLLIPLFILAHALCILWADRFAFYPLERRYWPEFLGMALAVSIIIMAATARFRRTIKLPYHIWKPVHGSAAALVTAAALVHVLFVSDPFSRGLPRTLGFSAGCLLLLLMAMVFKRNAFPRPPAFQVKSVAPLGTDATRVQLAPLGNPRGFHHELAGQFAFVTLLHPAIPMEPHPFTLASAPGRDPEFFIRHCGDWTHDLAALCPGTPVALEGPFGLFSLAAYPGAQAVVFIAGGIGITPALSMIRHMAETRDDRPATLLWSLKSPTDLQADLLGDQLTETLPQLRLITHLSRTAQGEPHRLTMESLAQYLDAPRVDTQYFICGPPGFMETVGNSLRRLGIPRSRISTEAFQL